MKKPNYLNLRKAPSCFNSVFNTIQQNNNIDLIVHGQGVFLFNTKVSTSFTFYNNDKSDGLKVDFLNNEVLVTRLSNSDKYTSQNKSGGIINKSGAYYWFSLDSQNQLLQAGIGEPRNDTSIYNYQFDKSDKLYEANKIFLESLKYISISKDINPLLLLKNPIIGSIPLLIKNTDELNMEDIAENRYLPHSSLSQTAQSLYNCVSGKNFILNTPDFPEFSDAIEYSIATEGCWCNTRLKEKQPNLVKTQIL